MSQYRLDRPNGNEVHYGYDAPTGGYFVNELVNPAKTEDDQVVIMQVGMLLSELLIFLKQNYKFEPDRKQLIKDWQEAEAPTPLQRQIGVMFGRGDPEENINRVSNEMYSLWLQKEE